MYTEGRPLSAQEGNLTKIDKNHMKNKVDKVMRSGSTFLLTFLLILSPFLDQNEPLGDQKDDPERVNKTPSFQDGSREAPGDDLGSIWD